MTHKERILAALNRERVDLFPHEDAIWGETVERYTKEGSIKEGEDLVSHFDMSFRCAGWPNCTADLDFEEQIVEETEETKLILNGNGAKLRWWKNRSGTPEHVDFTVKDRASWEEIARPHLVKFDERRINIDEYGEVKKRAADENRAFAWSGIAPFEQMHPLCGHEYMLMGMALDPDWVKDMVMVYTDLTIMHLEPMFDKHGAPDFFFVYEDMGFKEKPFMSPAMYEDIMLPGHKKLFDFAHGKGCKVMVHSCGFVAPLVPGLIEAGMDCLQAMEVKAGMDLVDLAAEFGDKVAFCGGMDIRVLEKNDLPAIEQELKHKIGAVVDAGSSYIVHTDHSIPPAVDHDTLKYFFETGAALASGK